MDFVPRAKDIKPVQSAQRLLSLAPCRTIGGKVATADEMASCFGHPVAVQWGGYPPNSTAIKRQRCAPFDDTIKVVAGNCAEASVKILIHHPTFED